MVDDTRSADARGASIGASALNALDRASDGVETFNQKLQTVQGIVEDGQAAWEALSSSGRVGASVLETFDQTSAGLGNLGQAVQAMQGALVDGRAALGDLIPAEGEGAALGASALEAFNWASSTVETFGQGIQTAQDLLADGRSAWEALSSVGDAGASLMDTFDLASQGIGALGNTIQSAKNALTQGGGASGKGPAAEGEGSSPAMSVLDGFDHASATMDSFGQGLQSMQDALAESRAKLGDLSALGPAGNSIAGALDGASSGVAALGQHVETAQTILADGRAAWEALSSVGDAGASFMDTFDMASKGIGALGKTFQSAKNALTKGGGASGEDAPPKISVLDGLDHASATMDSFGQGIESVQNALAESRAKLGDLSALGPAGDFIIGALDGASSGMAMLGQHVQMVQGVLADGRAKWEAIQGVKTQFSELGTSINGIKEAFQGLAALPPPNVPAAPAGQGGGGAEAKSAGHLDRLGAAIGGRVQRIDDIVGHLAGGLTDKIAPALAGGARNLAATTQSVSHLAGQFPGLSNAVGETIMKFAGLEGGAYEGMDGLTFLQNGLASLGSTFTSAAGFITHGAEAVKIGATAFRTLNAAIIANPIGAVIAAVVIAAGLIYAYWEPISGFFTGLWERIKGAFNDGIGSIISLFMSFSPVGLMAQAIGALTDYLFGIDLFEYGKKIWDSFTSGIGGWLFGSSDDEDEDEKEEASSKAAPSKKPSSGEPALGERVTAGSGTLGTPVAEALGAGTARSAIPPVRAPTGALPVMADAQSALVASASAATPTAGGGDVSLNAPITVTVQGSADGADIATRVRAALDDTLRRMEREQGRALYA